MKRILKFLDSHLEEYLIAILLILLTMIMLLQIVMRYVFNNSLSWPEELCRYCFVYITFLTLGYCVQRGSMLRLDIIQEILPKKVWAVLQAMVHLVTLAFFVCMLVYSFDLLASMQKTNRVSAALGIPYTYIYLSTVLGFALALIRSIQVICKPMIRHFSKRKEGDL
ncbi:TRAP transporter small permease [Hominifimenecus sp. rT4P-3]|uniref:TRAP transporter small permease n=1 Tax=Hominifimenecus sp. rT4P-3 TaxID=3242979 RepID=UPI003DA3EF7D